MAESVLDNEELNYMKPNRHEVCDEAHSIRAYA